MTEEKYKRAVQINESITNLSETIDHIKGTSKHRLWYACKSNEFGSEWILTPEWAMMNISDILDKHDLMIRQEIEEEIKKLKEEIREL